MTAGPACGPAVRPATAAGILLVAALLGGVLGGCGGPAHRTPAMRTSAVATPSSADALGRLVLTGLPSGLPRMPDDQLQPRAGEKTVDDVAAYAQDPVRERGVLRGYGFRWGWERFWGRGPTETSVFVEQFTRTAGAAAFAADLAVNEERHYRAVLHENPPELPAGCRLLSVDQPDPKLGLTGPTALAWCAHGAFSIAVTAVGTSVAAATGEVASVVRAQLARLPAG